MEVEEEKDDPQIQAQRKHCLESRLINILKKKKDQVLPLDQIIQLIWESLKLFKPSEEFIKERLEAITEKDYAVRESGGYRYKA